MIKKSPRQQENYKKKIHDTRRGFQKNIVRWMRVGICIPSIPVLCIVLPFGGPHSLLMLIATPALILGHLILSTLFIRKRLENYCPIFLNIEISILVLIAIETMEPYVDGRMFFGLLVAVEISLVFCLLLVSKLPFKNVVLSFFIFSIHLLYRTFSEPNSWINIFFFPSIEAFLLYIYWKLEVLDFHIFCELQKKQSNLLQFKQLVQNFPNQIIITNEASYKERKALYMNDGAKKLSHNLDIKSFFDIFRIDDVVGNEENKIKTSGSLDNILQDLFNDKEKLSQTPMNHYLATLNKHLLKIEWQKSLKQSLDLGEQMIRTNKEVENTLDSFPTSDIVRKFEIVIGQIDWDNNENKDNPDQNALVIMLNDVSKHERIRELKMMHANKDRLLATVSHELRTPLNGIIGMLDITDEKIEDKKTKKYVNIAKNSAKILLLMINDILDTFQIQRGLLKLQCESVNINNMIENVIALMRTQIKKKGLILSYSNCCEPDTAVWADRIRLQQILFNLLSNAFKFTEAGAIKVQVYPTNTNGTENNCTMDNMGSKLDDIVLESENIVTMKTEEITIKVTDSGRGIKPEVMPELFKIFGKFEVSGNETGVGLGLAISQSLAKKMTLKGIQVKSLYGEGSEFWMSLAKAYDSCPEKDPELRGRGEVPRSPDKKLLLKNISRALSPKAKAKTFKTVLAVDDDQVNQMVIGKYLSAQKFLILEKVFNGEEAVQCVQRRARENKFFDLILMDCNMPIMDGFQATRIIRGMISKGEIPELKILAITANVSEADRSACLSCGMNDVLPKPIQKDDFNARVNLYLNPLTEIL